MHKEIVISHFLHPSLNQVEVGRVGVERVSEVAMVTEEEREGRGGGGGQRREGGMEGMCPLNTVQWSTNAMLHTC